MGPGNVSPFTASHVEQGDLGVSLRCTRNDEAREISGFRFALLEMRGQRWVFNQRGILLGMSRILCF